MKKEARLLLEKAINSLTLSTEHFNRPSDRGRIEAVLIFSNHAFEMLLKAAILHKGGRIRKPREKQTLGFDECVRKCLSDGKVRFLVNEDALLLQAINGFRDAAHHHLVDLSEQHLYLHSQAGLTLFRDLLDRVFKKDLRVELPRRVLPLSTTPPTDLTTLFESEVEEVKRLLRPGKRKRVEATAKLRGLAILEAAVQGEKGQPAQGEIRKLGMAIQRGQAWHQIFPGVASINLAATGVGPSIDLRITKKEGTPIQIVPEGTPGASVVAVRRVDELGFYNLGHVQLKEKVGLNGPKTTAAVEYLGLKKDPDCFKLIQIGKAKFGRYSQKAIERINEELKKTTIGEIWREYQRKRKGIN